MSDAITSKPHLNIGTLGHVDHGKSTLTSAILTVLDKQGKAKKLSYQEIDDTQGSKSSGSKQRGKTINASHFEFNSEKRHYALIDCPGHRDYLKNMITGAAQMDGAILVVSVEDGAMDQTKEHIKLAKQVGVEHLIVFLNKVDVVLDLEQIELTKMEIKEELAKVGYEAEKIPIIGGSALCASEGREPEMGEKSILELLETLDNHIPTPQRDLDKPFLMWIEKKYLLPIGVVVTGTPKRGKIETGEEIEIIGFGLRKTANVKGTQSFRKNIKAVKAGDDAGLLLGGVDFEEIRRGQVVVKVAKKGEEKVTSHTKFIARVYIFGSKEGGRKSPFKSGFRPQFFFDMADTTGTIKILGSDEEMVGGGEVGKDVEIEVSLEEGDDVVIEKGSHFIVQEGYINVGEGTVTKVIE